MSDNLPAIRQQIVEAQQSGDVARANELYRAELAARSGPAAQTTTAPAVPAPLPAETVSAVWAEMERTDADSARQLKARWGDDAPRNMAFAAAWMTANMTPDEIAAAPNDPVLLEMAARMGRDLVHAAPAPAAAPHNSNAGGSAVDVREMDAVAWDRHIRGLRQETEEAQARGDSLLANTLYQRQMEAIAMREGSGPIVDGRRTA